eukprot:scaffold7738_cov601-Pinguiococcus_pyrenoidosus.AAC.2
MKWRPSPLQRRPDSQQEPTTQVMAGIASEEGDKVSTASPITASSPGSPHWSDSLAALQDVKYPATPETSEVVRTRPSLPDVLRDTVTKSRSGYSGYSTSVTKR